MNELIFLEKWNLEKPMHQAWGNFIVHTIKNKLQDHGIEDLDSFIKIPIKSRLKEENSLLDKAFRRNKPYVDPYAEIEDKVGIRFVVLLTSHIDLISEIIQEYTFWNFDLSKDFKAEQAKDPLIFTYQSVHFILRPKEVFTYDGVEIHPSTPCEVQIRTLLQHAHAELTHDAIYKSKKIAEPLVHRTVAKSMALIETTDEFFCKVTEQLNSGPLTELKIVEQLDSLYLTLTDLQPNNQKSSLSIWDAFEAYINDSLIDDIQKFIKKNPYISLIIKEKYTKNSIYRQSIVIFIYWMLKKNKNTLLKDWPLPLEELDSLASDIGVSIGID
ncbi:RelA/SpoT domain-containing protein [Acinetobacter sp. CWB-G5]|uniref:GTP pyrophosphokinase n=1 Tax=Acinetobacter sp. CWB-G5 TaxID=2855444 RepID=UPI001C48552A|nr:RelA/SpoT domain-containing protein [Acinetobacter sp. CWB-G5]MBV7307290.1 RelA/SpoT domain-containing protein [Acinetobacter sp. CWB-G5]